MKGQQPKIFDSLHTNEKHHKVNRPQDSRLNDDIRYRWNKKVSDLIFHSTLTLKEIAEYTIE
ncbi:hypothetical protein HGP28_04675 [Vibrio sp. SM6]|uniref:Uncharacterized protein n=1 Tax=Vibrio agarilyticus TaxID=2726741 RepID=A0A7X8YFR7_9VIBR|nr:hypothetical protein [Vibrio agarilyticus]NLS12188.1 hypothetical protein [Vibrio agarilyticus]